MIGAQNKNTLPILILSIGNQFYGACIHDISDVIRRQKSTKVPLSGTHIAGLLNLRGYIVTELNMLEILGIDRASVTKPKREYSLVVNNDDELYSLVFDNIGDVIDIPLSKIEKLPETMTDKWSALSKGVIGLPHNLVIILDLKAIVKSLPALATD
jgi:purine-binding chemotaxis protein CheW